MSVYYATYEPHDGYIHNWIVAGPQAIPVVDLGRLEEEDSGPQIARYYHEEDSDISEPPVDWDKFTVGDTELRWTYYGCRDDHFVDLSAFYHACHYLRAWAYTRVASPAAQEVTLVLTTNGPADVWLNGQHAHRQEHFYHQIPHSVPFQATPQEGHNEILVRFEEVAVRECPFVMALQVIGLADDTDGAEVSIPVPVAAVARRQTLEDVFEAAYLERDVYAYDEKIIVHWPEDMAKRELRSCGQHNVWLCHMGRATLDGGFAELPAEQMEIRYGDQAMRLSFEL